MGSRLHSRRAVAERLRHSARHYSADTQGQSLPVYGLAALLRFELLPRIRNWHDLIFYRPGPNIRYQHIDSLFGPHAIDWRLLEQHWPDLLRTAISVREGRPGARHDAHHLRDVTQRQGLIALFSSEYGWVVTAGRFKLG